MALADLPVPKKGVLRQIKLDEIDFIIEPISPTGFVPLLFGSTRKKIHLYRRAELAGENVALIRIDGDILGISRTERAARENRCGCMPLLGCWR
jgi:hypothetical protein